jgi:hypothetical protein
VVRVVIAELGPPSVAAPVAISLPSHLPEKPEPKKPGRPYLGKVTINEKQSTEPIDKSDELRPGVIASFDAGGNVVALEIVRLFTYQIRARLSLRF